MGETCAKAKIAFAARCAKGGLMPQPWHRSQGEVNHDTRRNYRRGWNSMGQPNARLPWEFWGSSPPDGDDAIARDIGEGL
jgi:hypothetical protein